MITQKNLESTEYKIQSEYYENSFLKQQLKIREGVTSISNRILSRSEIWGVAGWVKGGAQSLHC